MTAEAAKPNTKWLDIANTIILAIASLLTAWNGYEATQWSGVQGEATNAALATRFEATRAAGTGDRHYLIDIIVFASWLDATRSGDQEMAEFLEARFREEFVPAFNIWLASQPLTNPDAPTTPFVLPEYMPADLKRADNLEQKAADLTAEARQAAETSRNYVQNTLYVSIALFFTGLARTFEGRLPTIILLAVAGFLILFTLGNMALMPIA